MTNAASGLPTYAGGRYTASTGWRNGTRGGWQARWHLPVVPLLVALAIIAGAALLLHPMTAAWFTSVEQSREIDKLTQGINDLGAETLHQRLAEAREYNRNLSGGGAAVTANERLPLADEPRPDNAPDHSSMLRGDFEGLMARFRIPSIKASRPPSSSRIWTKSRSVMHPTYPVIRGGWSSRAA